MKSLYEYDVLVNDLFYRGYPILDYLNRKNIQKLDKEAIFATIMDTLVYKGLINKDTDFLDRDTLMITNINKDNVYKYTSKPFVIGIPLWIKESLRLKKIKIAGGIPASVHLARKAGKTHYCVYDANTVVSSVFEDFNFIEADYDSPTREGIRVIKRPFLEVDINGAMYLVDVLTKRIFLTDEFIKKYNMEITYKINYKDFNHEQESFYREQVGPSPTSYGSFLSLMEPLIEDMRKQHVALEYIYEVDKSKEYFSEDWLEKDELQAEYEKYLKNKQYLLAPKK